MTIFTKIYFLLFRARSFIAKHGVLLVLSYAHVSVDRTDASVLSGRGLLRLSERGAGRAAPLFEGAPSLVKRLGLAGSNLSSLSDTVQRSLDSAQLMKLNNIQLSAVPSAALSQVPNLRTLDLNQNRISQLRRHQLQPLPCLGHLSIAENGLRRVEVGALPASLKHVGLLGNQLHTLNGTVR